jgi:hypothetical protein
MSGAGDAEPLFTPAQWNERTQHFEGTALSGVLDYTALQEENEALKRRIAVLERFVRSYQELSNMATNAVIEYMFQ